MKFFEKMNKKTLLKAIFILVIILFNIGIAVFDKDDDTSSTSETVQQTENETDDTKKPFEDVHIGASNVIIFCGLCIALGIVRHNKTKIPNRDKAGKEK